MSLIRRLEGNSGSSLGGNGPRPPDEAGARRSALPTGPVQNVSADFRSRIQARLIQEMNPRTDLSNIGEIRARIQEMFDQILEEEEITLVRAKRLQLFEEIAADIIGLGPLEPLLRDESVSEVMVNGPRLVYVERKGHIEKTGVSFSDDDHVRRIIDRIIAPLGRRIDESSPMVDARLLDGSRVNAIIPPLSLVGPCLTIRKFAKNPLQVEDLVRFGSITPQVVEFLRACVLGRMNIIVAGGTGSGKTTLLNVLSGFIPSDERIVTIEDAAELQLRQEHVITLETRKPNMEGKGAVTIRDLVVNCLRMRPDRIVVGEVRGGEALDMLQAMNTGHDGSLTTLHANSPRDALARLETMVLMAGMDLPLRAIREQTTSAVQLIVFQERLHDGTRRVTYVTEVVGMENETVVTQDIYRFHNLGMRDGKIIGELRPTGLRPKLSTRLEHVNIHLPGQLFQA